MKQRDEGLLYKFKTNLGGIMNGSFKQSQNKANSKYCKTSSQNVLRYNSTHHQQLNGEKGKTLTT